MRRRRGGRPTLDRKSGACTVNGCRSRCQHSTRGETASLAMRKRACTAGAALVAVVLADLLGLAQAFSHSAAAVRTLGLRRSRSWLGGSSCDGGRMAPASRPWGRRKQHQHHEAAGLTVASCVGPSTRGAGSTTTTNRRSISGPRRRLSLCRALSSMNTAKLAVTSRSGSSSNSVTITADDSSDQQQLQLLPGTVLLRPGDPIEVWHAQSLVLANFAHPVPGRQTLVVRMETGEQRAIDAGQIVGVWQEDEMSGPLPSGSGTGGVGEGAVEAWAEIRERATALLQGIPARGLDLGPFWRAANARGKGFVVTPAHAAEFLFGAESSVKLGLRKRPPFQFRSPGTSFLPSAVERTAAALVLSSDRSRFKRVVSQRLGEVGDSGGDSRSRKNKRTKSANIKNDGKRAAAAAGESGELVVSGEEGREQPPPPPAQQQPVVISVGGFKAVDTNAVVTREVADFCGVVRKVKQAAAATAARIAAEHGGAAAGAGRKDGEESGESALSRAGLFEPAFLLILHSLEAFAIGGDEQFVNSEARRAMMELVGKINPAAAKSILVDIGLWTARPQQQQQQQQGQPLMVSAAEDGDSRTIASGGDGGDDAGGGDSGVISFSAEALQAAAALGRERARRSANYGKKEPQEKVGAPAPFGRHDFRRATYGVYCIDGAGTRFLDDAFSIDPATREVFIHITDVQAMVSPGSTLDNVARLRAASEYLPQGPLFMMPPTALEAMSFSGKPDAVNEGVTVGIRLDPKTGEVVSSRVMLTVLPPVIPLTTYQTDKVLEAAEKGETGEGRLARVAKEIQALEYLARRSAEASGRRERGTEGVKFRKSRGGEVQAVEVAKSRSRSMVDELLTVYTQEAYRLCKKAGVAMPSLVGHQNRVANGVCRYGTGPLRRYIDILAQRQMAAIIRGTGYLKKEDLMETASYLTWRQNKIRAGRNEEAGRLALETLAAHCSAQTKATGLRHAVVPAWGTGQGRQVRLGGGLGGVLVHAKRAPGSGGRGVAIHKGQSVRVVIERVEPQQKLVVATEFPEEPGAGAGIEDEERAGGVGGVARAGAGKSPEGASATVAGARQKGGGGGGGEHRNVA